MLKAQKITVFTQIFSIAAVMVIAAIFGIYTFNKTFPLAEGWYSVYSDLVLKGQMPYRDFEFLYTPLYLYIIVAINAVFGADIIVLRIAGAILFMLLGVAAYFIFKQVFSRKVAAVSAVVTIFVMQSEIVQVFYDYIRFYDFFNYLGILLFIKMIKASESNIYLGKLLAFGSGLIFTLSLLIRQSSGLINWTLGAVIIIFTMLLYSNKKSRLSLFIYYLMGLIFTLSILTIILIANGLLEQFITMAFTGALSSNGGIYAVLFAFIPRLFANKVYVLVGSVFVAALSIIIYRNLKLDKLQNKGKFKSLYFIIYILLIITALITAFNLPEFSKFFAGFSVWGITNLLFFVNIFILIFLFVNLCINSNLLHKDFMALFIISVFIFGTAYGSGTSGGISEGQAALSYGFILGLLLSFALANKRSAFYATISLMLCFTVTLCSATRKIIYPYNWWGLSEQSYYQAKYYTNIDKLKGIKVSSETKYILETISDKINQGVGSGDTIYCFPQIPVFYYITQITPSVNSVVPWFDVATDASIEKDLENLKIHKPKFIVAAIIPEYVMDTHERDFRESKTSAQRQVYDFIENELAEGNYKKVFFNRVNADDYSIMLLELSS